MQWTAAATPLREYPVRTHRVIPLRQRLDGLVDPPDDGVQPLSLHDVAEELDDGVVRHTARPDVRVPLHHAVGALAQMRVLHILDALQWFLSTQLYQKNLASYVKG